MPMLATPSAQVHRVGLFGINRCLRWVTNCGISVWAIGRSLLFYGVFVCLFLFLFLLFHEASIHPFINPIPDPHSANYPTPLRTSPRPELRKPFLVPYLGHAWISEIL